MTSLPYWPCWPFLGTILEQRGTLNSCTVRNSCTKPSSRTHPAGHKDAPSFTFLERVWSWQWIFVTSLGSRTQRELPKRWARKQSALGSAADPAGDHPHHRWEHPGHPGGISGEKVAICHQLLFNIPGGGRFARGAVCDADCPSHNTLWQRLAFSNCLVSHLAVPWCPLLHSFHHAPLCHLTRPLYCH